MTPKKSDNASNVLKNTLAATQGTEGIPAPAIAPQKPAVPEIVWQQYKSAKVSVKTITDAGVRISFTCHQYFTDVPAVIEWLDTEIKAGGLPGITKGEEMTTAERDPMTLLKRKHIEEYKAEQEAIAVNLAKGIVPDMGNTKKANEAAINPSNSGQVANGL